MGSACTALEKKEARGWPSASVKEPAKTVQGVEVHIHAKRNLGSNEKGSSRLIMSPEKDGMSTVNSPMWCGGRGG